MARNSSQHLTAVLQALFVTLLWSTSWVLIKIGLADMPALTFAGLRYGLAALCLLPFVLRSANVTVLRGLSRREWISLMALGIIYIAITQGAQFLGLAFLPAVTVSLLLNFTPIIVVLTSIPVLAERPSPLQWAGVGLYVIGILIYFYPMFLPSAEAIGVIIVLVGVLANAVSSVLGRHINRQAHLPPLIVTSISMGTGSIALLIGGATVQSFPTLTSTSWLIVIWLAVVNTAFAFTLWNRTLRTLSAMESSIINGTMLPQIALLAWVFLDEQLTQQQILGMVVIGAATLIVQLRRGRAERRRTIDEGRRET